MDDAQLLRYARHILLDELGIEGQERLLGARVLHRPAGRGFQPEFDAIFRGTARLIW